MSFSLRKLEPDDLPLLYAWENDDASWCDSCTHNPLSRQDLRSYIESTTGDIYRDGQLRLMIVRHTEPAQLEDSVAHMQSSPCGGSERISEVCGCIDLFDFDARNRKAAIGIYIAPYARGNGVGHAAVRGLLRYAFGFLHLRMVYAVISVHNEPCTKLFEKEGFVPSTRLSSWTLEGDAVVWQYVNNVSP